MPLPGQQAHTADPALGRLLIQPVSLARQYLLAQGRQRQWPFNPFQVGPGFGNQWRRRINQRPQQRMKHHVAQIRQRLTLGHQFGKHPAEGDFAKLANNLQ
ncbi:hypothetical protein D3C77_573270 [compost metagenome]